MTKRTLQKPSEEPTIRTLDDLGIGLNASAASSASAAKNVEPEHFRFKKFKNSLDSDEDDDELIAKANDVLDPDDLEGQEDETIDRDGEIRITPFNMKDELEEGHFDKEGTFIFKKSDEIKDHWLDNIDWIKIKERPLKPDSESDSEDEQIDIMAYYQEMINLMQPKETILRAIKRLGGNSKTTGAKWSKKQSGKPVESDEDIANREKLIHLTALADKVLGTGDMDIYQQTFEKLNYLVQTKLKSKEDAADMFGDDFDAKEVASADAEKRTSTVESTTLISSTSNEVLWEFKWEDKSDAPVYGPHPSSEMLRWVEEGYFKDGVLVRKINEANTPFYTSNRIDFDLYT